MPSDDLHRKKNWFINGATKKCYRDFFWCVLKMGGGGGGGAISAPFPMEFR